ncbi:MAG: hypothetical protein ACYDAY_02615 [Candidatus Dormibacteria bacterium]
MTEVRSGERGSVLGGVLIMVLLLAIVGGTLLTQVTTHLVAENNLRSRVITESSLSAVVQAAEQSILQAGAPTAACATDASLGTRLPLSMSVNSVFVTASLQCQRNFSTASILDTLDENGKTPGNFALDGIINTVRSPNDFAVTDSNGRLYDYSLGTTTSAARTALWSFDLAEGSGKPVTVASPPLAVVVGPNYDLFQPITNPSLDKNICDKSANYCLAQIKEAGGTPSLVCDKDVLNGPVAGHIELGAVLTTTMFVADQASTPKLSAITVAGCGPGSTAGTVTLAGTALAGPFVVNGTGADDHQYVVLNTTPPTLAHYCSGALVTGNQCSDVGTSFTLRNTTTLQAGTTVGADFATTGAGTALAAVSYQSGLELVNLNTSAGTTTSATYITIPASYCPAAGACVTAAPRICVTATCGANYVAVATLGGYLLVYDSTLTLAGFLPALAPGSTSPYPMQDRPATDSSGEWVVGADDGFIYRSSLAVSGTLMPLLGRYGVPGSVSPAAPVRSSPQIGTCDTGHVCAYYGSSAGNSISAASDLLQLSTGTGTGRVDDMFACEVASLGSTACTSGANPRAWTRVQFDYGASPTAAHAYDWSYYSP